MRLSTRSIRTLCYSPSVKTRMQAEKSTDARGQVRKQLGIIETLLAIVRSKAGPKALYRGFATNMLNAFVQRRCRG